MADLIYLCISAGSLNYLFINLHQCEENTLNFLFCWLSFCQIFFLFPTRNDVAATEFFRGHFSVDFLDVIITQRTTGLEVFHVGYVENVVML